MCAFNSKYSLQSNLKSDKSLSSSVQVRLLWSYTPKPQLLNRY